MAEPYDTQLKQAMSAGKPDPLDFRKARVLAGFEDGTALASGVAQTVLSPISGALSVRLRGKLSVAADLDFTYRRNSPNVDTAYDTSLAPPSGTVSVLADTEFLVDIVPKGEAYLAVTITPDDDGVVTFFDIMQE